MPVEVQASSNLGLSKGQHRTAFRNPRGQKAWYSFYLRDSDDHLMYEVSTDGSDWTGSPVEQTLAAIQSFDLKIHDTGTDLKIYLVWSSTTNVRWQRGNIADGGTSITWDSSQTVVNNANSLPADSCVAIARTDNARLVVAFINDGHDKSNTYRETRLIGSDGDGASPTWSGETTWDDPSSSSNNQDKDEVWFGLENFGSTQGDRVLLHARVPESTNTSSYSAVTAVPDWNGSTFSNTTQAVLAGGGSNEGTNISGLIDASDFAHVLFRGTISSLLRLWSKKAGTAGDDDWGTEVEVVDAAIDACTLALDTGPATDELYAFYHDSADTQDFHYKKTPVDTISWGTEQTITFASDLIALTSWNRDVESSLHIGIEDADTDVHYHEHALAAPAFIPEPPFMVEQAVNRAGTY